MLHAIFSSPWPWWVAGPAIGAMVPALLIIGGRAFGISSNLRHMCAVVMPGRAEYFAYDWRRVGGWNLVFALGIVIGGLIAGHFGANEGATQLSAATRSSLLGLGVHDLTGLVPRELFAWSTLANARTASMLVVGGLLVGFGTAYAGGCTSGHAISGLADFQLPSLVAVIGFFAGGLASAWFVLPWLVGAAR